MSTLSPMAKSVAPSGPADDGDRAVVQPDLVFRAGAEIDCLRDRAGQTVFAGDDICAGAFQRHALRPQQHDRPGIAGKAAVRHDPVVADGHDRIVAGRFACAPQYGGFAR